VGRVAAQNVLETQDSLGKLRGKFFDYKPALLDNSIPLLATFHPSALLRDPTNKRPAWEDLKLLKNFLDGAK
jgi:DNA polymerase